MSRQLATDRFTSWHLVVDPTSETVTVTKLRHIEGVVGVIISLNQHASVNTETTLDRIMIISGLS